MRKGKHGRKLTDEQIVFMRCLRVEEKTPLWMLSGMYGVSIGSASDICSGKSYAEVGGPRTSKRNKVYASRNEGDGSWETTI